jgi:transposase
MGALEVFMSKKTRRRYSDEFKDDAVNLVRVEGYGIAEAARRLDIDRSLLDRWCRQQREQVQGVPEAQGDERDAEIKKLREEVRKLRMEKDILKKATAFFVKESS